MKNHEKLYDTRRIKVFWLQCDLMGHPILNVKLCSKTTLYHKNKQHLNAIFQKLNNYLTLKKIILKRLFDTWTFDNYLTVIQNRLREKCKKNQNIKQMISGILHKRWLGKMVVGLDCVRKLNAFEEHYLAWILFLQDETLVQETKYLALHFCWFSEIMLCWNLEYLAKCELLVLTLLCLTLYARA